MNLGRSQVTVSHNAVCAQPHVSVSCTTGGEIKGAILNVHRLYDLLPNSLGGSGRIKSLDHNGRQFTSSKEAWRFAYEHGYTQMWSRKWFDPMDLRASERKAKAQGIKW